MKQIIANILLLLIFVLGIVGAGELVWKEITIHNVCPKIIGIPTCYIVLLLFIIPFTSHVLKMGNRLFFILIGIGFIIALSASIMQFNEVLDCPKSFSGIALCYFSLIIFSCLLILKKIILDYESKNLQADF